MSERASVVIDVGCATHGGDASIPHIVTELEPDLIIGLDPAGPNSVFFDRGTSVVTFRAAAWMYDGEIGFVPGGLSGHVQEDAEQKFPCVDLARVIRDLGDATVTLKMDAEGSEYELLPYLIQQGLDERLDLAWIEWHCPTCGRGHWWDEPDCQQDPRRAEIEQSIRCRLDTWKR